MDSSKFDPVVKLSVGIIAVVIVAIVLKELQHIFVPFVVAYLIFFIFQPLNSFLKEHKIPSPIVLVTDLFLVIIFIFGISQFIVDSFYRFGERLPYYESKLNSIVSTTAHSFGFTSPILTDFKIGEILQTLDYGGLASGFFSSTLDVFTAIFFVLFFFIFIYGGHKNIYEAIRRRFVTSRTAELTDEDRHAKMEQRFAKTLRDIVEQIQRYITFKFLISLFSGFVLGIILWIFDVDFFLVWAVFAVLLNFIPNIGSSIAILMPALMVLVQYESFGYALFFVGVAAVFQNLIGNIIEPLFLGNKLGLNPLVILLSLLIWGYIWGIVGMLLSVPLTAVLKIIVSSSESRDLIFLGDLMDNEEFPP